MRTPFKLLALGIAATSGALVLLVTGVLPNSTMYSAQISLPAMVHHARLAQTASHAPSPDPQGEILGAAIRGTTPQEVNSGDQFVTLSELNQVLDKYTRASMLSGVTVSAPSTGMVSSTLAQTSTSAATTGLVSNGNGQTTAVIGGNPIVTYVASVPASNFSGTSLAGFGSLSAGTFDSGNATINGNLNVSGPVFTGSITSSGDVSIAGAFAAATSTVSALTVSGPATFSGSTTIAGLTVLGLNPGLTQGSIAFQGASGLSQDNLNLFYDATSHRLGIGTTSPVATLAVQGSGVTPMLSVTSSSGTNALYVTSNGNVGVGTTSPAQKLDVWGNLQVGTSSTPTLFVNTATSNVGIGTTLLTQSAPVGSELTDSTGWTTTGWTGDYNGGFVHTVGQTATLSRSVGSTGTKLYQVSFTVTSVTSSSDVTVTLGNSVPYDIYKGGGTTTSYTAGIQSLSDGPLVFTPGSGFDGTISAVSVKQITGTFSSALRVMDSASGNALEIRPTAASLQNAFVGAGAGQYNTTGFQNAALGTGVLASNTTGFWNSAVGYLALNKNTTGARNIAMGYNALLNNVSGLRNVAVGTFSLPQNTTGNYNIAIGSDAQYVNTTGSSNIAMGHDTLGSNIQMRSNPGVRTRKRCMMWPWSGTRSSTFSLSSQI